LVHAQNALLIQSRSDETGRAHPDGWGIAYYDGGPHLEKQASAAFHGLHFSSAAERVYSTTVLSHVRLASVGQPDVLNCHPFQWASWVFAHNGTVTGIEWLRAELHAELSEARRRLIRGHTDSELLFHWLMERASRDRAVDARGCLSLDRLAASLAEGILEVDQRCGKSSATSPAKLNVLLSDGRVMLACRYRNRLRWLYRDGIRDCEICGIPHVEHMPGKKYHAVVIASEPLSQEAWEELPDGTLLSLDERIEPRFWPIAELSPRRSE
jgi:glutamine amidotransferase